MISMEWKFPRKRYYKPRWWSSRWRTAGNIRRTSKMQRKIWRANRIYWGKKLEVI